MCSTIEAVWTIAFGETANRINSRKFQLPGDAEPLSALRSKYYLLAPSPLFLGRRLGADGTVATAVVARSWPQLHHHHHHPSIFRAFPYTLRNPQVQDFIAPNRAIIRRTRFKSFFAQLTREFFFSSSLIKVKKGRNFLH